MACWLLADRALSGANDLLLTDWSPGSQSVWSKTFSAGCLIWTIMTFIQPKKVLVSAIESRSCQGHVWLIWKLCYLWWDYNFITKTLWPAYIVRIEVHLFSKPMAMIHIGTLHSGKKVFNGFYTPFVFTYTYCHPKVNRDTICLIRPCNYTRKYLSHM